MFATVSSKKPLSYQGSENRRLKRTQSLFVNNFTVTTSTLQQSSQSFTHKNNDAKHENGCLLTSQRTLPIVINRFNQAPSWSGQPNQPKTVFSQKNTKKLNQSNQPKTVDPNRTRPKTYAIEGYHNVGMTRVLSYQYFSVLTHV